jgi:hypothetical protein
MSTKHPIHVELTVGEASVVVSANTTKQLAKAQKHAQKLLLLVLATQQGVETQETTPIGFTNLPAQVELFVEPEVVWEDE